MTLEHELYRNPSNAEHLAASSLALLASYGDFVHSFEVINHDMIGRQDDRTVERRSSRPSWPVTEEEVEDASDPVYVEAQLSILAMLV